jgi:ribosome biogenesis protein BMS1
VERAPRTFNPLHIPSALQQQLPFKSKPKLVNEASCCAKGFIIYVSSVHSLFSPLPLPPSHPQEAPRKRQTLEQKRAVVHTTKQEKAAYSLVQQLNTLRNTRAGKRRAAQQQRLQKSEKAKAKVEATRHEALKRVRKQRYVANRQTRATG